MEWKTAYENLQSYEKAEYEANTYAIKARLEHIDVDQQVEELTKDSARPLKAPYRPAIVESGAVGACRELYMMSNTLTVKYNSDKTRLERLQRWIEINNHQPVEGCVYPYALRDERENILPNEEQMRLHLVTRKARQFLQEQNHRENEEAALAQDIYQEMKERLERESEERMMNVELQEKAVVDNITKKYSDVACWNSIDYTSDNHGNLKTGIVDHLQTFEEEFSEEKERELQELINSFNIKFPNGIPKERRAEPKQQTFKKAMQQEEVAELDDKLPVFKLPWRAPSGKESASTSGNPVDAFVSFQPHLASHTVQSLIPQKRAAIDDAVLVSNKKIDRNLHNLKEETLPGNSNS